MSAWLSFWSLGDFTFMKIHKILGVLWIAFCAFLGIMLLLAFFRIFTDPRFKPSPFLFLSIPVCIIAATASIFLFRGARWASIVVGIFAFLVFITCIWLIKPLSIWSGSLALFALVSVYVLLSPKRDTVA